MEKRMIGIPQFEIHSSKGQQIYKRSGNLSLKSFAASGEINTEQSASNEPVRIVPFQMFSINKLQIHKQPNEHATAMFSGNLSAELGQRYMEQYFAGTPIKIYASDDTGTEKQVFNGMLEQMELEVVNDAHCLTVTCISHTKLMDIDKKTWTLQDVKQSYLDVAKQIEQEDNQFSIYVPENGSKAIGELLVRYEETAWAFARRVASRLGTVLIPDYLLDNPCASIGIPKLPSISEIKLDSYTLVKNLEQYYSKKEKISNFTERDVTCYKVKSRKIYELCVPVTLHGMQLIVAQIDSEYTGSTLIHTYLLKEKSGLRQNEFYNEKLIGATLTGTVKEVKEDVVRFKMDKDIQQKKYIWLPYSTVFSSPDGTGWYFMPEVGDEVRLRFPTEKENDAYVLSSVHTSHDSRSDPDTKFISTKYEKKITFAPDYISITNGHGSSILLSDEDGIEIKTKKSIKMRASNGVNLTSRGKVSITGAKGVTIKQNDSAFYINENIQMSSGHVRVR